MLCRKRREIERRIGVYDSMRLWPSTYKGEIADLNKGRLTLYSVYHYRVELVITISLGTK